MDETILRKLEQYCAYQERCHSEVRTKLLNLGSRGMDLEEIISQLIATNYLNEERFAFAFVGGKFRIKKWGRVKIRQQLKAKGISEYLINKALKQIDQSEYFGVLVNQMEKKLALLSQEHPSKRKAKLLRFLQAKGYETPLILEAFKDWEASEKG